MLRSSLNWKLPGRLEALVMQHLSEEISGSAKSLKRNSDHETGGSGSDLQDNGDGSDNGVVATLNKVPENINEMIM